MSQWRGTLAETDRLTFVYVAEQDGAICGFGSAGTIRWTGLLTGSEVSALYLLDAVKRRGIGRMLLIRLLGELAARGFTSHRALGADAEYAGAALLRGDGRPHRRHAH